MQKSKIYQFINALILLLVFIFLTNQSAKAEEITPIYGVTNMDINNDGNKGFFIRGRVNLSNAHSYDSYVFILDDGRIIPFDMDNKFLTSINSIEGAECSIRKMYIVKDKELKIVIAERYLSKDYSEKEFVYFTEYLLFKNLEELPGIPSVYFKASSVKKTNYKYCDVQKAWETEYSIP